MKNQSRARNITLGLTDGLTIPFALAAGLTALLKSSPLIFGVCFAVTIAYAFTMGMSAYLSGKKYEPSPHNLSSALIVSISYIAGGVTTACPFFFFNDPVYALKISAFITTGLLLISGYYDSYINEANGVYGALRVTLTGLVAAGAAFGIALLFR